VKRLAGVLALAGLAAATLLIARHGFTNVRAVLVSAGDGIVWASLFHVVPIAANARAWQALLGRRGRSLALLTWLIWVREAVNGLLPVARVGGEVADARILIRRGVRSATIVGSLVVSMTVTLATQLVFTLIGLLLLLRHNPQGALARAALIAACAAVPALVAVGLLQRFGLFQRVHQMVRAIAGERFAALIGDVHRLDRTVRAMWLRRTRIARCAAWQLVGWIVAAGEIWIFAWFAGAPMPILDAILVESLVQALNSAAFVVPGALGVQEGAFLALGNLVGLPANVSLALAVSRRARDVLIFVPALVIWQGTEARWVLRARGAASRDRA
jgi:glycosyltransferase 2 family protein